MRAVVPINKTVAVMNDQANLPAVSVDPWRQATQKQQETALLREQFIRPVLDHIHSGVSQNVAVRNLLAHLEAGLLGDRFESVARSLGRNNKVPGRSSILNWVKHYRESGRNGLLDSYTGRVRQDRGWEAVAVQLYNIPSKPSFSAVAIRLREEYGFADASDSAVRRYLKNLPATLNTNSPMRLGKHYHQQNRGKYVMRDATVLQVGEVYEGDGHTVDTYIAHPNHGGPWRPELTVWIDVRSHYIAGWYLSEAESALSTLFALSNALVTHDHVPAWLHIDNGSGYKSKLMSDENTGFYARFNMSTSFSIPGNSKGKGLVEHWFRTFRDHHDKFFNGGQDYCGHDMADEINRRLSDHIKQGKRKLLGFNEYRDSVARFIHAYNHRATKSLGGKSPIELWQQLQPVPVELPAAAIIRPQAERTVRRCCVQLHNRYYEHTALAQYDGRTVRVEYDVHTDDRVWICDDKNRLICEAPLKTKIAWMPESRLEEARKKREKGRLKRLEKKAELIRAEERGAIDHTDTLHSLEQFGADHQELIIRDEPEGAITLDIDIYDDSYLEE